MENLSHLGGAIATLNVLDGVAPIKWCFREEAANELDNGWRFFSEIDSEEYVNDPANLTVVAWDTIIDLEPAVMPIFDMPVGTEIGIVRQNNKIYLLDAESGEELEFGPEAFSVYTRSDAGDDPQRSPDQEGK